MNAVVINRGKLWAVVMVGLVSTTGISDAHEPDLNSVKGVPWKRSSNYKLHTCGIMPA